MTCRRCGGVLREDEPFNTQLRLAGIGRRRSACLNAHSVYEDYALPPLGERGAGIERRAQHKATTCLQCGSPILHPTGPTNRLHPACRKVRRTLRERAKGGAR